MQRTALRAAADAECKMAFGRDDVNQFSDQHLLRRAARAQLRVVERFLQVWDPIGVFRSQVGDGVLPTEYDTYAPQALRLLREGCSAEVLCDFLASTRARLGVGTDPASDRTLAEGLLAWWRHSGGSAAHDEL